MTDQTFPHLVVTPAAEPVAAPTPRAALPVWTMPESRRASISVVATRKPGCGRARHLALVPPEAAPE
ncbi:MAG: hypothetical protein MUF14_07615 [Hyphomonadaceae bacterium]|jgi:hypothetical protein|nr:hypothetical protein [Hyphomonadaceae bacterium]